MVKSLADNQKVKTWLQTNDYAPTETFSFTTSDSVRLDGSIVKPIPSTRRRSTRGLRDLRRPGSQQVYNEWTAAAGSSGSPSRATSWSD